MNRLPVLYGYAGIIPFAIIALTMMFVDVTSSEELKAGGMLQVAYGAMILSFLGGIHWGQAIPRHHTRQITFSMIPTIAGFVMFILAVFGLVFTALIGTAVMFFVVYEADKRMMPVEYLPPGYFRYRRNLTFIVVGLLIVTAVTVI